MKPAIPLTDPRFDYVNAACTNLHARFAKIRLELRIEAQQAADRRAELQTPVAYVQAIADNFAARRAVLDLERERQFRLMCDVSAGKK